MMSFLLETLHSMRGGSNKRFFPCCKQAYDFDILCLDC